MPDAQTLQTLQTKGTPLGGGPEFVQAMNMRLHDLSQPITVLLCTLDYSGSLDSVVEMKQMLTLSQEACERLRKIVVAMQIQVREAMGQTMEER